MAAMFNSVKLSMGAFFTRISQGLVSKDEDLAIVANWINGCLTTLMGLVSTINKKSTVDKEEIIELWSTKHVETSLLFLYAACVATAILANFSRKSNFRLYQWRSIVIGVITLLIMAGNRMNLMMICTTLVAPLFTIGWSIFKIVGAKEKPAAARSDSTDAP
ncbi:hypothetical protein ISN45_Aa06g004610 [Arabidopsis thaliana x Arabidopsis arenosa]|uniref:Uncharacterized protein n=1 Tax=Arabidopsis thaliana x Arabidopsis arenosa TaxID=1240361 RepID=A0A8T1YTH9_9BRAS|nr:hypothetical protein ISN45_Aa06g004610 [Arabidopsis thaliana x Arabidopsis arenosa]